MAKKICVCTCHIDGRDETHMQACCDNTEAKYIDADWHLDINRYDKLNN